MFEGEEEQVITLQARTTRCADEPSQMLRADELPMPRPRPSDAHGGRDVRDAILSAVADGTVLRGTAATLAFSLGAPVADFRSGLRELLEAERIVVTAEPHGQLTIRLEQRGLRSSPPRIVRHRPQSDIAG